MQTREKLLAPQEALWNYLDALLREIPPDDPPAVDFADSEEIQDWDPAALEPATPVVVKPAPLALPEAVPAELPPLLPEPMPAPAAEAEPRRPRPDWAQAEFQALLFAVGGLTLAVPLATLHSVLPWPEDGITGMPNQPAWCFGLLRYRERNVRVVDTGTMVIPPDREELLPADPPKHLLIVGDGHWALACSAIGKVVRLTAEDVRWRSDTRSRPWLAGTVLNHLCALVDTEAFARMLADAGARRPSWRSVGASPRSAAAQGET